MIIAMRALLAVVLLVGAYVLMLAMALFCLALVAVSIWSLVQGTFQPTFVWALAGGGLALLAVVRGMIRASLPGDEPADAVEVTRARAPELWRMMVELAERIGTRAPDELWLTGEANAAVSESSRLLGLLAGRRRLYVGVPLLAGLPTDELRAILCHELGHYARGHTRLGPVTYRGSVALTAVRRNLALAALSNHFARMYGGIPFYLLSGYAWLYDRISLAVRRRQEYDADAEAARITGKHVTAGALRSRDTISAAWTDFHTRFVEPMRRRGSVPDDLFSAFQAMINDPDYRDVLALHRQQPPPERPTSLRDSHPSDSDRLAALDRLPDTDVARDPTSPLELLPQPEKLVRRLSRSLTPIPWQDWLVAIANHHAAERLDELSVAVAGSRTAVLVPGDVLDLLESGQAARLDTALAKPPGAVPRQALCEAVLTLVGQAMVQAGSATWTVPWTGTQRLVTRDSTPEEIEDLVRAAVNRPTEVSRLRLELAASEVDITRALTPPARTSGRTSSGPASYDDEDLVEEQRSSVKLVLGVVGAVVVIAILVSLGGRSEDKPANPRPAYPPALNTQYYLPTLIQRPTFTVPRFTFTLPPGLIESLVPLPTGAVIGH